MKNLTRPCAAWRAAALALVLTLGVAGCAPDARANSVTCGEFTRMTPSSFLPSEEQNKIIATLLREKGFDDSSTNLSIAGSQVLVACLSEPDGTKIAQLKGVWR